MSMNKVKMTPGKNKMNDLAEIALDIDIGHKVISIAEELGVNAAEVFMVKDVESGFSIENDTVTFSSSSTEFGIGIRVIKDKRLGFGYCTSLANAERALKNAMATTRLAKQLEFEFATKEKIRPIPEIFDKNILGLTVDEGLSYTDQLIGAVKETDPRVIVTGGGVGFGGGSVAILNSNGIELEYSGTGIYGGVSTILKDKSISTGFEYQHSRKNDIDMSSVGKLAADLALKGQNPKKIESGNYNVIYTPHAMGELLEYTIIPGLYGEPAKKGETVYSNKLGELVTSQSVSLMDDGTLEKGINTAPVDDEGTPCRKNILVENGVLKRYLFDRLSGLEFGDESTGNAVRTEGFSGGRNYKAIPKTKALNFTMAGKTRPLEKMISEVDSGLVVHQLLGAHTANPASGDFSVNCPTLFRIENGDITIACKQVMISGNMPELMKRIINLGDDFRCVSGGLTPISQWLPSVEFENVKII